MRRSLCVCACLRVKVKHSFCVRWLGTHNCVCFIFFFIFSSPFLGIDIPCTSIGHTLTHTHTHWAFQILEFVFVVHCLSEYWCRLCAVHAVHVLVTLYVRDLCYECMTDQLEWKIKNKTSTCRKLGCQLFQPLALAFCSEQINGAWTMIGD